MLTFDISRPFLINRQPAHLVLPRQNLTDVENAACHMPKHCKGDVWWVKCDRTPRIPYTGRGHNQQGLHLHWWSIGSLIRRGPRCKPNPNTFNRYYGGGFELALEYWARQPFPYSDEVMWLFSDPSEAAYFKLHYG